MATVMTTDGQVLSQEQEIALLTALGMDEGYARFVVAQRLQVAVNDWLQERTTLHDLVKELQPTFGRRRARVIAQTETTRAATEGYARFVVALGSGEIAGDVVEGGVNAEDGNGVSPDVS